MRHESGRLSFILTATADYSLANFSSNHLTYELDLGCLDAHQQQESDV